MTAPDDCALWDEASRSALAITAHTRRRDFAAVEALIRPMTRPELFRLVGALAGLANGLGDKSTQLAERCGDPHRWPEILDRMILSEAERGNDGHGQ